MAAIRHVLILFLFLSPLFSSSQQYIQWQKSFGGSMSDQAFSVQETFDGGCILAGSTSSNDSDVSGNHGGTDYWLVKLDFHGSIEWQKCLGGSLSDNAYAIRQTNDSGYIVAGSSVSNDGDLTGNYGLGDYWVIKLNNVGGIQWQKNLGGSGDDVASSVEQTMDGGFIVAGRSTSNDNNVTVNHGSSDYWLVKLDSGGAIQWQKSLGGSDGDIAYSIQQTFDGGYAVAGYTSSYDGDVTNNHGGLDFWVVKLDGTGTFQWQKCLGGYGGEVAYSIGQTSDSGYVLAGTALPGNNGVYDFWVIKINASGTMQWHQNMGGSNSDLAYSIRQTNDGGYLVAGRSNSNDSDLTGNNGGYDYWVVKLSNNATIEWQKNMGGSLDDIAENIWQTSDSGFIVAGRSKSNDMDVTGNNGNWDFWVVKLGWNPAGTVEINQAVSNLMLAPNPVSTFTVISFTLTHPESISAAISDMTGRTIKVLADGRLDAGNHQLKWNLTEGQVAGGIYLLKICSPGFSLARRVVVVK